MKLLAATALSLMFAAPVFARAAKDAASTMVISRAGSQPSSQGPAQNFTGSVRVDPLFPARAPAVTSGALVTFEPGARSAWHTHPHGRCWW